MALTKKDLKELLKLEFTPLREDISDLKKEVKGLSSRQTKIENQLTNVDSRLSKFENRLTSLEEEISNLKKESKETQRTVNDVYLIADATLKKLNIVETEFRTLRDAKLPRISKVVVAIAKKKQNVAS